MTLGRHPRTASLMCARLLARLRFLAVSPIWRLLQWLLKKQDYTETHRGILLSYSFDDSGTHDPLFVPKMRETLDLLAELDARRFRRVQNNINAIVAGALKGHTVGRYGREGAVCLLDFGKVRLQQMPGNLAKRCACVLVHEATHGLLDKRGVVQSAANKKRVERLCIEEEIRLSRRFQDGHEKQWAKALREKQDRVDAYLSSSADQRKEHAMKILNIAFYCFVSLAASVVMGLAGYMVSLSSFPGIHSKVLSIAVPAVPTFILVFAFLWMHDKGRRRP